MDLGNQLILIGAGLVVLSIFVGLVSSRIGAPLLLVFLVLGMLAGEDGPGGVDFDNFWVTYVIGSISLAVILFDGGLRTPHASFNLAKWPALVLATVAVVMTATLTGIFAMWALGLASWIEGLLVGSIVASTDAAAVFFLLQSHNARLKERIKATLEVESGLNDPMAVFLTVTCVELIGAGGITGLDPAYTISAFLGLFALQIAGGAVIGFAGGYILLRLVNRLQLASGLYPVLAVSFALLVFGGAQSLGMSGFLAVYLTGLILGNYRHRATQLINRFQDGLTWLSQIVMFLMLGLLVTPSAILPMLGGALAIAFFLIVVGRPAAVILCLLPFGFTAAERTFVSWVGLRGAVPIFLGTVPVLAGIPGAEGYFIVAYVVVVTSLIVQGWTVMPAARYLGLGLPPIAEASAQRVDMDLPAEIGLEMTAYTVQPDSGVVNRPVGHVPMPPGTEIVSVIRDGTMRSAAMAARLAPGDYVILTAPAERIALLDQLFATAAPGTLRRGLNAQMGEFSFHGDVGLKALAAFYGFAVPQGSEDAALADFLAARFAGQPQVGDRTPVQNIELIVQELDNGRITKVAIALEPRHRALRLTLAPLWKSIARRLGWRTGGSED